MHALARSLASRTSALVFLGMAGSLMFFGASSPDAFASGVWNFKLLQSVLLFLGAGLGVHLALNFRKQFFSHRAGGWLLHAGLLGVIMGGGWNYLGSESKIIEVIEGQDVPAFENERIRLDSFDAFYKPGRQFKGAAATVSVVNKEGQQRQLIHVNRPGSLGKTEILIDKHGFATLLHFRDSAGKTIDYAFVSLQTEFKEKKGARPDYRRSIKLPGTDHVVHLQFQPASNGGLPTDPKLSIFSAKQADPNSPKTLSPGERAPLGDMTVAFEELRYWSRFKIRRDPGIPLVFAGFAVALLGAGIAFGRSLAN